MTTQQFLDLNPCVDGKLYALKFPTIKEAWLACNDINNIYWLINEAVKDYSLKNSLYLVFAEECAGRALTYASYASAYAADAADADADAYAARKKNQLQTANICREFLTAEVMKIIKEKYEQNAKNR